MAADRILVFAKRPAAGHVKTRLTPPLPPDEAAAVYEACLRDVIVRAAHERAQVEIWYRDELRAREYFEKELTHLPLHAQAQGDLGARMHDAFARSFADGAERIVIIGSDSPTLPEAIMHAAFDDLREVSLVLGPSVDGGYYLIGIERTAWAGAGPLFHAIGWSGPDVFKTTVERAERAGLSLRLLPGWYDVDTIEDLRRAVIDSRGDSHLCRWASRAETTHLLNA